MNILAREMYRELALNHRDCRDEDKYNACRYKLAFMPKYKHNWLGRDISVDMFQSLTSFLSHNMLNELLTIYKIPALYIAVTDLLWAVKHDADIYIMKRYTIVEQKLIARAILIGQGHEVLKMSTSLLEFLLSIKPLDKTDADSFGFILDIEVDEISGILGVDSIINMLQIKNYFLPILYF